MLEKYGLQSSVASGNYNIAREPLYFVRSGYIHLSSANRLLVEMGSRGRNWVASAFTYSNAAWSVAYNFDFRASGVNPSGGPNNRYFGFPVRCLVY